MKAIQQRVELEWITPDPLYLIERAARTCYKSDPTTEDSGEFVKRIAINQGHASVIEHASASFRVITDRAIGNEVVRHRIASYSQESTRYVNYTKEKHGGGDIQFIHPLDLTEEQLRFSIRAYKICEALYNRAIKLKMTPQQARDYLPLGTKTEFVMTTNFREWLHFLKLRTSPAAHPKMRVLAKMIGEILAVECSALFGQYAAPQS
jgi:thymidylate synthase (FAD)